MKISRLSDKQRNYSLTLLLLAGIVGLVLGTHSDVQTLPGVPHAPTDASEMAVPQAYTAAAKSVMPAGTGNDMPAMDAPTVPAQIAEPVSTWTMGDVKAATPTIPLHEKVSQYEIVHVERPANYPAAGQQITFPMLNGKKLIANVQSVSLNPNGDYTWSGHIDGFGTDYPVVMTYGEHSIFATVTTPEGSYTMESVDGSGWLYKNPSEFELSKPGFKDYLEVDNAQ